MEPNQSIEIIISLKEIAMRVAILGVLSPMLLLCQVAAVPSFEVASIKASYGRRIDGYSHSSIDTPSPGRLVVENSSLGELIRYAFQLKVYQLTGPAWLDDDSQCFDINAKAAPFHSTDKDVRLMLQALLTDRFKLIQHRETKLLPVFKLTVGKTGPKFHPAVSDGQPPGTSSVGDTLTATHVFMSTFAAWLSKKLPRPVINQTELQGRYDFVLRFDGKGEDGPLSLTTALQEQLGLRLESGKTDIEVLVVDHVEKAPTEN